MSVFTIASIHGPFGKAAVDESMQRLHHWRNTRGKDRCIVVVGDTNASKRTLHREFPTAQIDGNGPDNCLVWNGKIVRKQVARAKHGSDHEPVIFDVQADSGETLRIATWNVWEGNTVANVRAGIKALVDEYDPDVIVLQEARHLFGRLGGLGFHPYQLPSKVKHDGAIPNTADCARLVKDGVTRDGTWSMPLTRTWIGPKHGNLQDPRTYLWFRVWKGEKPKPKPTPKPDGRDRYDRVTFRGKTVNKWTRAALLACEKALGYELTIVQGSYHKGTSASAGTHDGGGVIDLAPFEAERKVRVLREHGFAAWHRLPSQGPWGEHVHAVLIGDTDAAPAAQRQVEAYRRGLNGLANGARDDGPRVPIKQFPYPPK